MISSIRNCIFTSFNHLVIHAQKLNLLTLRIKEYVAHKFKNIGDCFKDFSFLRNRRVNSSNLPSTTQSNNENVHQVATATLNPAISTFQQPQSTTSLIPAQEPELASNRAEELELIRPLTTNLGSNSSESVNLLVNNQPLTLDRLNINQVAISALDLNSPPQPQNPPDLVSNPPDESGVNQPTMLSTAVSNSSENVNSVVNTLDRLNEALEVWKNDSNVTGNKLEASNRIRQAFQNKSINLDLSGLILTNLPSIIGQLTQLQTLDLSRNKLQGLPAEIGNLTQLQWLYLASNQLQGLPAEIGQLTQLQTLDLSRNKLQGLPAEIGHLTQLKELYLNHNQLQGLPAEIGHLTQLQTLDLNYNKRLCCINSKV